MRITLLVASLVCASAGAAAAECRDSAAGAYSVDVSLSPAAGCLCLMTVAVFEGPGCAEGRELWFDTRGCNETDRMAITDHGHLVSILAPATGHRDWSIVSLLAWRDGQVHAHRLALEDLPETAALAGIVRPRFEGAAIRFSPDLLVSFERLEAAVGL